MALVLAAALGPWLGGLDDRLILTSLGNILGDGRDAVLLGAWWIVVFPSALLVAATLAVSGIASVWRDRLVPRRRSELAL